MSSDRPPLPPDPFDVQPLVRRWTRPFIRVHHSKYGASEFNPGRGAGGRFDPLRDTDGNVIPTLYGAGTLDGALAEATFGKIALRGDRTLALSSLIPMQASTIRSRRPMRLIDLRGFGLPRLGVSRRELIDSNSQHYPVTRAWAEALYRAVTEADGMVWIARQHDMSEAILLFGTRVNRDELEVVEPPRPLAGSRGVDRAVVKAARAAGIIIVLKP